MPAKEYVPYSKPGLRHFFFSPGQAMVGSAEDDPDVKALTIALVNGRIVDATIRYAVLTFR